MIPCKRNEHRDEGTNIEAGEVVTFYNCLEKATLKFGAGSVKYILIMKINTVFFLLMCISDSSEVLKCLQKDQTEFLSGLLHYNIGPRYDISSQSKYLGHYFCLLRELHLSLCS